MLPRCPSLKDTNTQILHSCWRVHQVKPKDRPIEQNGLSGYRRAGCSRDPSGAGLGGCARKMRRRRDAHHLHILIGK
ncbi:hypothetical protein Ae201684P_016204 [Aphanomyces euteiches]|uniref:Uncharacterized protein n=1 Tax=Aphanomyces euteiches TaxID=100861 RepID=A0A6G0XIS6_9STRA|nr:hypothetical protein Ae201684_004456 [Aphanomyces euteiches]KAH9093577.1 hypothetical protein Ae201684P_016204 [Aphanomyces euteiches]